MKVAVIYMAAGNSRRFAMAKQKRSGQRNEGLYPGNEEKNKLLQKLEGKPLYLYGLETLAALRERHNEAEIFVITRFQEILESAGERGMKAFLNRRVKKAYPIPSEEASGRHKRPESLTICCLSPRISPG